MPLSPAPMQMSGRERNGARGAYHGIRGRIREELAPFLVALNNCLASPKRHFRFTIGAPSVPGQIGAGRGKTSNDDTRN